MRRVDFDNKSSSNTQVLAMVQFPAYFIGGVTKTLSDALSVLLKLHYATTEHYTHAQ